MAKIIWESEAVFLNAIQGDRRSGGCDARLGYMSVLVDHGIRDEDVRAAAAVLALHPKVTIDGIHIAISLERGAGLSHPPRFTKSADSWNARLIRLDNCSTYTYYPQTHQSHGNYPQQCGCLWGACPESWLQPRRCAEPGPRRRRSFCVRWSVPAPTMSCWSCRCRRRTSSRSEIAHPSRRPARTVPVPGVVGLGASSENVGILCQDNKYSAKGHQVG